MVYVVSRNEKILVQFVVWQFPYFTYSLSSLCLYILLMVIYSSVFVKKKKIDDSLIVFWLKCTPSAFTCSK